MNNSLKPETLCVQGGWQPKKGEPRVLPIYQSTTFKYDTSEQMAKLFDLEESGYFYTRLQNPTNDAVAAKIAALEGGVGAMLTSSGQAANFYAVFNICQAGDHMVCSSTIYGGTFNLFGVTMKKLGIEVIFVDPDASEEEISAAFRPNTKALFGETLSNPGMSVLDIEKFARIAHSHGVPLIVDNTFATPINCRPFEWGADIVTHSTTKYMDGHATSVGGAVVDSGNFDWDAHADKFPGLTTPDESYHGLTYTKAFGKMACMTKATAQLMRDLGSIQAPMNAFLLNLGLETLHLRMPQHCKNAQQVAEWLEANEQVAWVNFPGLKSNKYYDLAQKYMPNGTCGVIAFGLKGSREDAIRFMDNLKMICIVTHVADARTCVLHPASHTHRQLTDEQLIEAGVAPDLIRLSVGIVVGSRREASALLPAARDEFVDKTVVFAFLSVLFGLAFLLLFCQQLRIVGCRVEDSLFEGACLGVVVVAECVEKVRYCVHCGFCLVVCFSVVNAYCGTVVAYEIEEVFAVSDGCCRAGKQLLSLAVGQRAVLHSHHHCRKEIWVVGHQRAE